MAFPRAFRCVLVASILLGGCGTVELYPEEEALPASEPYAADPAPAPKVAEESTRFIAGAFGMQGRVEGQAAGAPSEHGMDLRSIPGFSLEVRFASRAEGSETFSTSGLLLEHFHSSEEKAVAGGSARTTGSLTAAWIFVGTAGDPVRDGDRPPTEFGRRFEIMGGLRRGAVQVEVPGGGGSTYRGSETWGEFALGLRAEVSPVRRVFLFTRADFGSQLNPRVHSEDEEAGGDSALGSISVQFTAGVRVRPVDHVSVVAGWRYLRLDGKQFVDDGRGDVETARASWAGPWAGIEVDF